MPQEPMSSFVSLRPFRLWKSMNADRAMPLFLPSILLAPIFGWIRTEKHFHSLERLGGNGGGLKKRCRNNIHSKKIRSVQFRADIFYNSTLLFSPITMRWPDRGWVPCTSTTCAFFPIMLSMMRRRVSINTFGNTMECSTSDRTIFAPSPIDVYGPIYDPSM